MDLTKARVTQDVTSWDVVVEELRLKIYFQNTPFTRELRVISSAEGSARDLEHMSLIPHQLHFSPFGSPNRPMAVLTYAGPKAVSVRQQYLLSGGPKVL